MIQFIKEHPDLGLAAMIEGIWRYTFPPAHHSPAEEDRGDLEQKRFSFFAIGCFVLTIVAQIFVPVILYAEAYVGHAGVPVDEEETSSTWCPTNTAKYQVR
jgi:hypothetical protein